MIEKRVKFNQMDEPVVTVVVTGYHDVIRFTEHMKYGQVEFYELGKRIYSSIRKKIGTARLNQLIDHCTGKVPWT